MRPRLISRSEVADDGLELQIRWETASHEDSLATDFSCMLHLSRGEVALIFGPSSLYERWPPFVYRYASFDQRGAALKLRLDPGLQPFQAGRMRALDLGGWSERGELLAMAGPLQKLLSHGGRDPRIAQAVAILQALPAAFDSPRRGERAMTPAARPELFAPSTLGCKVDDVHESEHRRHVRLSYPIPRLRGFWTHTCTWRVFQTARTFGLEFRAAADDHPPPELLKGGQADEEEDVLRVGLNLDLPVRLLSTPKALSPASKQLLGALTRQTALDLPARATAGGEAWPFGAGRWRHWLRLMPDMLAGQTAQGVPSKYETPMQ